MCSVLGMVHNFPKGLSTFYMGVYKLVDDPSSDSIISWSKSNHSFIVWRLEEFNRSFLRSVGLLSNNFKQVSSTLRFMALTESRGRSGNLDMRIL